MITSRRGFLTVLGGVGTAAALSGCGILTPKTAPTHGTPSVAGMQLEAGWVSKKSAYAGANTTLSGATPSTQRCCTPHFGSQLKQYGTFQKLSSDAGTALGLPYSREGYRPAPGHEFVGVQIDGRYPSYAGDGTTKYTLIVDGKDNVVDEPFGTFTEQDSTYSTPRLQQGSLMLMASVPVGKPVVFQVKDLERTLRLDCRTGKLEPGKDADGLAILNAVDRGRFEKNTYKFDATYTYPRSYGNTMETDGVSMELKLMQATLMPWHTERAWAPAGKVWLRATAILSGSHRLYGDMTFNVKDVFSFTAGGKTYQPVIDKKLQLTKDLNSYPGAQLELLFEVPFETREGELHYDNKAPMTHSKDPKPEPKKDETRSAPFVTKVTFA